eukprot:scpid104357/ scgid3674/ Actin-18; Actin-3-sub 2
MADSSEEIDGLVLDLGSIRWRCGFAGDGSPRYYNESVLGRSRLSHKSNESATSPPIRKTEDTYIGDEAVRRRESLSLSFPIQRGIVTDWDDMQTVCVWLQALLAASPADCAMYVVCIAQVNLS